MSIIGLMINPLTEQIFEAYKGNANDFDVFKLQSREGEQFSGIQVVRNYPYGKRLEKGKQFIRFFVDEKSNVSGGVEMVEQSEDYGWEVKDTSSIKGISNYMLSSSDQIIFDREKMEVHTNRKIFTVTEFIDHLEKKHLSDMFFLDKKIFNPLRKVILHIIFGFVDRSYNPYAYLFINKPGILKTDVQLKSIEPAIDPLFKYFYLYSNPFAFFVGLSIPISYFLSTTLEPTYFSIQNPFLIFSTMGLLLLIEEVGLFINKKINDKDSFVARLSERALQERGNV